MAIKGSLREASLADVLQLLALGRKTGCLSVSDRGSFGHIYFDEGMITQAAIVNRRDRLGDLLVKNGEIDADQLRDAVAEQTSRSSPRLGEILIRRGVLTRQSLERFIRLQIEEAVYYLFTWNQGTFYFEADDVPDAEEVTVLINPEGLLLEGARRVDEWTLIEKKVVPEMVFAVDRSHGDPERAELSDTERRVLPHIDGSRSVREVVEEAGLLEFDGCKAVFGLVQAGYLRNRGKKREAAVEEVRPGRIQEHRNLGFAFYRTSMFEEAEREFLKVLEIEPTNREAQFFLGSIALRQRRSRPAIRRLMRLIESGGGQASSFHNLSLALELSGRVEDASMAVDEALKEFPRDRALLLARAILLTRRGEFTRGCEAFDAYDSVRVSNAAGEEPASYYVYSIVALGGAGRLVDAMVRAKEGADRHSRAPRLLVNAAAAHERSGDIETAEALYRRAVEEGPELPQARRGLADTLYRRGAYDEAGAIYERLARAEGPVSPETLFKLGNIAYKRGDRAMALSYWRETVDADPSHAVARTNLELVEGALDAVQK